MGEVIKHEKKLTYHSQSVNLTYIPMGLVDRGFKLILLVHIDDQLVSCSLSKQIATERMYAFRHAHKNILGMHTLHWDYFEPEDIIDKELKAYVKELL